MRSNTFSEEERKTINIHLEAGRIMGILFLMHTSISFWDLCNRLFSLLFF